MIDIWGRSLSMLIKISTNGIAGTSAAGDVKKLIEDEISEMLNLASIDPHEIIVFQDLQGKLKLLMFPQMIF